MQEEPFPADPPQRITGAKEGRKSFNLLLNFFTLQSKACTIFTGKPRNDTSMLLGAVDQSLFLILILLVFLLQIPCSTCQSSAKAQKQQPDQRVPVITGLRCGRCLLLRSFRPAPCFQPRFTPMTIVPTLCSTQ